MKTGKRKRSGAPRKPSSNKQADIDLSDNQSDIDLDLSDFEIDFQDKILQRNKDNGDSEAEVFGVGGDSTDDDEEEEENKLPDSDIEGAEDDEDYLPNVKAWGNKKSSFYSTDYVDPERRGYDEKDREAAEQEEEEARAIQKRLMEQLDETDFSLDLFSKKPEQKEAEVREMIKTDLEKMTKREKLALLQKESPEFFGLTEQFKTSMTELQEKLDPIRKLIKEGKIPASPADKYINTKYHLLLNFCMNITFYLLLKAKRISVQSHPVVRRLYQYHQLLKQLEPVDEVMAPQIDAMLEAMAHGEAVFPVANNGSHKTRKSKEKKLNLLSHLGTETKNRKDGAKVTFSAEVLEAEQEKDRRMESDEDRRMESDEDMVENSETNIEEEEKEKKDEEKDGDGQKRAVTYQIMKNKGLTPRRKKEDRNPRVKLRNKFRKATIRRKGQVRLPRKELQKYGGEISGIKIGVVKSIKLK